MNRFCAHTASRSVMISRLLCFSVAAALMWNDILLLHIIHVYRTGMMCSVCCLFSNLVSGGVKMLSL